MGRNRKLFPNGKLRLMAPKNAQADKRYSICYEYCIFRKPVRRQSGYTARIADWDGKQLKASYGQDYREVNNILANRISKYDAIVAKYAQEHPDRLTADIIKDILEEKGVCRQDEGKDFCDFVLSYLKSEYNKNKISFSTYNNGRSAINIFKQFLVSTSHGTYKPDSIYLGEITPELVNEYILYKQNIKHNCSATINHALTPIIKACKYACALGLIGHKIGVLLDDCRISEIEEYDANEKFDGKYLVVEQLSRLAQYCDEEQCRDRQREYIIMFLFAFHACGLRVSDIITLRWKDIDFEQKKITKNQIKTKRRNTIPLTQGAKDILENWEKTHSKQNFVFGLLPDDFDLNNAEDIYNRRNSVTASINQSLRVVGEKIGLPFTLTFHVARHSFAMYALNEKKIQMSKVSQMLGHASSEITERIYAKYLPKTLSDDLIDMSLDIPIPKIKK